MHDREKPAISAVRPTVWLIGDVDHSELVESVSLVRATADAVCVADVRFAAERLAGVDCPPELIVFAVSRPGMMPASAVERIHRLAPLAGVVALLGTWCEGETRTGRPWPGVGRLYWYEFGPWWWRQLALRAEGRCPEWANSDDCGLQRAGSSPTPSPAGLAVLNTTCWETADALSSVLRPAGYATAWTKRRRPSARIRGATAGIWEGCQLDENESRDLTEFCGRLADDGASVVALLDFPRRDRIERARDIGVAAVLAKPWRNDELLAALDEVQHHQQQTSFTPRRARAA